MIQLTGLWCVDDSASVRLRGTAAITNFPLLAYHSDLAAHELRQVCFYLRQRSVMQL